MNNKKAKIRVFVMGEMGNQLFHYAFARAISIEKGLPIVFCDCSLMNLLIVLRFPQTNLVKTRMPNRIKIFDTPEWKTQNPLISFISSVFPTVHAVIFRTKQFDYEFTSNLIYKMSKRGKLWATDTSFWGFYPIQIPKKKNIDVFGAFESEKYFYKHREQIKSELKVKTPISEKNQRMIDELRIGNSVAVHIRLGDYETIPKVNKNLNICNEDYYLRAMRVASEKIENPVFYIFSNDIPKVKNTFNFKYPVKYIDLNNPGIEDFRLMYNCKHFVIPNSTFSWWASYLSDNPGKITVVPSLWTREPFNSSDRYREDFVLVEVK